MFTGELYIEKIKVFANHGWYESEREMGGNYEISIWISWSVDRLDKFDDIKQTINYELICSKVERIMLQPFMLIEQSGRAIFDEILKMEGVTQLKVQMRKLNVPIKNVTSTQFTLSNY